MSPGISTRLLATQSDERLLGLVREGHERAFEALVNRYRRPLLNYCRRLSLPEARTEDVLQQALLKTWIALRDGAEVRDIKAWLYRVVHNAAVNAVRDAAHERERVSDPTLRIGGTQADIERGLVVREALAEVAALPPLQREVIVRTAVGGDSHEQVATDLGITDGAVRGLLYRARATLRTATTALTPPQLIAWIAARADQGGVAAPERLSELAAGGGTVGFGGLLVKGGVAAVTAGTLLTGAAVVHLQEPSHSQRAPASARVHSPATAGTSSTSPIATTSVSLSAARSSGSVRGRGNGVGSGGGGRVRNVALALSRAPREVRRGGSRGAVQRGAAVVRRRAAVTTPTSPGGSTQDVATTQGASTPSGGSAQGQSGSGAQSDPVGSAAGAGSGGGSEGASGAGSGGGETAPSGGEPGGSTSGGGESPGATGGSEGSGGSGGSESSGGEQSGGLVKTVVHEVGSVVEHLLH
jgi:RNA polymerase sigma factor (sigma-70 family)